MRGVINQPAPNGAAPFLRAWLGLVLIWLLFSALARPPQAASAALAAVLPGQYVSDEVVVRLKPGAAISSVRPYAAGYAIRLHADLPSLNVKVLKVPDGKVFTVVDALRHAPAVVFAEPHYLVHAAVITPSDPAWASQYGPVKIQAPQAWEITTGSISVTLAVIDTGIDLNHPDLASQIWQNPGETPANGVDDDGDGYVDDWRGWDFVNGDNQPQDDSGHGTHVAGIAAAAGDNNTGIAGIAWNVRLMPLKVLDRSGEGTNTDLALALRWAADHHADIINLSLGDSNPDPVMEEAVDYAYAHGVTVVAAAGNSSSSGVLYPAVYTNTIAVAATDSSNRVAGFSSYGPEVDLAAPGVGIYSTYWNIFSGSTYGTLSGTSMAAPHVAGVAALLAGLPQFNSPDTIRLALESTALDLGAPCRDPYYGLGLAQAFAALNYDLTNKPMKRCYFFPFLVASGSLQ